MNVLRHIHLKSCYPNSTKQNVLDTNPGLRQRTKLWRLADSNGMYVQWVEVLATKFIEEKAR
jgi:hypothetical protein